MGDVIRDIILGGQDGLVNVLGLALGVAVATQTTQMVLVSGLVGTFAESISMAAVAYTGFKAAKDVNRSARGRVRKFMLKEYGHPVHSAVLVGLASLIGSLIPLIPFFFMPVQQAMYGSAGLCAVILFILGSYEGKLAKRDTTRAGVELLIIGMLAALAGFVIGLVIKNIFI
ncbi:MAG: VIT1/CCC1 transporter family protein [Candidatus Woesearchaeota archaeon]|jgi:predicted membrane protein (TIGR00267 family)|nr:VIT1/CCC1 transporter family protein [Candidatus Woesearchaeota archaeon]MDP7182177.1 VIT1/CCC1 transporter family protein [Candidatus Woesearchaeota archaeon]MDP7199314.1 VIT1/CCC1 transporter family protein [Candidatus Woesearchaeota archaeon]MDP7467951.1 VIT1/CCC1 transporter family protein [Candidatus Woesearchaeota archaeon]MDP7647575.1 VIT1/CCC1 transporter family protein [Candidatus Woesearchaeota archaeon]